MTEQSDRQDPQDQPVDLSALDPTLPPSAFEERLAGVREATRFALLRRRDGRNALFVVARWRVPLMAALFLVIVASAAVLRAVQAESGPPADATSEIADVLSDSISAEDSLLSTTTTATDLLLGGF